MTNKPEAFSRTILAHFGLLAALDAVIGGDSGYPKKPAPEMLLTACASLGSAPDAAVLIAVLANQPELSANDLFLA